MGYYKDLDITPEEEERIIQKIAEKILSLQMETIAILLLESSKPLVWIGGELGRFLISPFVPAISEDLGIKTEKLFRIFEQRPNVERLIKKIETMIIENEKKKKEIKKKTENKPKDS
ncbi:MAG: hypothetical protein MUO21_11985 [Nitrososphaeraceae archaeon]|nr:hypothetical protein [Nitrososphaeraceae archaeon]